MTIPEYLSSGEKARLIPVAADSSKEGRATSVVLATLMSVPPFAKVMLIRDLAAEFSGSKTFIEALEDAVPSFYDQVGQRLRAYVPSPPRIRKDDAAQAADTPLEEVAEEAEMAAATAADESRLPRTARDE